MLQKRRSNFASQAENYAANLLASLRYKIIDRNFHSRFGEIDIIAIHKDTLVFVEVKARNGRNFGLPEESVGTHKLNKIKLTGEYYLTLHKSLPQKLRIDVVALEFQDDSIVSSKIIQVGS